MIDHQAAPLGFELFARFDQLLALPVDSALLFLFFRGHAHQRQGATIALDEAVQLQAERLGIEPVGFYPPVALIQLLWANHVTVNAQCTQLALQAKTKPARFVNGVHFCSLTFEPGCPMQKRLLLKTLRRLGVAPAHLLDHHVKILVHINSKLDRSSAAIKLAAGFLV